MGREDSFSTPARRRRIIADVARNAVRLYCNEGCKSIAYSKNRNYAAVVVQCSFRSYRALGTISKLRNAKLRRLALVIQCLVRSFIAKRTVSILRAKRRARSALLIQCAWRVFLAARLVRKARAQFLLERRIASAIKIQEYIRNYNRRKKYLLELRSAIRMQCRGRVWLAARKVKALRIIQRAKALLIKRILQWWMRRIKRRTAAAVVLQRYTRWRKVFLASRTIQCFLRRRIALMRRYLLREDLRISRLRDEVEIRAVATIDLLLLLTQLGPEAVLKWFLRNSVLNYTVLGGFSLGSVLLQVIEVSESSFLQYKPFSPLPRIIGSRRPSTDVVLMNSESDGGGDVKDEQDSDRVLVVERWPDPPKCEEPSGSFFPSNWSQWVSAFPLPVLPVLAVLPVKLDGKVGGSSVSRSRTNSKEKVPTAITHNNFNNTSNHELSALGMVGVVGVGATVSVDFKDSSILLQIILNDDKMTFPMTFASSRRSEELLSTVLNVEETDSDRQKAITKITFRLEAACGDAQKLSQLALAEDRIRRKSWKSTLKSESYESEENNENNQNSISGVRNEEIFRFKDLLVSVLRSESYTPVRRPPYFLPATSHSISAPSATSFSPILASSSSHISRRASSSSSPLLSRSSSMDSPTKGAYSLRVMLERHLAQEETPILKILDEVAVHKPEPSPPPRKVYPLPPMPVRAMELKVTLVAPPVVVPPAKIPPKIIKKPVKQRLRCPSAPFRREIVILIPIPDDWVLVAPIDYHKCATRVQVCHVRYPYRDIRGSIFNPIK